MALREHTFDLTDRVGEITERLSEIESEKKELEEEGQGYIENDEEIPDKVEEDWDDLCSEETELRGELFKFREAVVEWTQDVDLNELHESLSREEYKDKIREMYSGVEQCRVRVRELTFGQLQRVSDDMMEESFEVDMERRDIEGTPRSGFYQTELLKESIIEWPQYAPETRNNRTHSMEPSPGDYPIPVAEWLFEKVDALNTTGDTDMGNSSLKETLRSKR